MKAVIYGAGNIGRGFIAALLYKSGYNTVFLDINKKLIDRINADRCYSVYIVDDQGTVKTDVKNVSATDSLNFDAAVNEIYTADIMATSVGAGVLPHIAKTVAAALEMRISDNKPPLNILLCENLNHANVIFKQHLFEHLSKKAKAVFDKYVGLVEASIGRMVPVLPPKEGENPLNVYVEPFDILHLDKDGFVGEMPQIKNMVAYSPFKYFIQRKLFIHNMCHAMCAYLGAVKGYEYISEAIRDIQIKYLVNMAGTYSAQAIAADNKQELSLLLHFLHKLIYRFSNTALKDTVKRVAKDPLRKLAPDDRITGAYTLCKKQDISTVYILICLAAAALYCDKENKSSCDMQNNIQKKGVTGALKDIWQKDILTCEDKKLLINFYNILKLNKFNKLISFAEKTSAQDIKNY